MNGTTARERKFIIACQERAITEYQAAIEAVNNCELTDKDRQTCLDILNGCIEKREARIAEQKKALQGK